MKTKKLASFSSLAGGTLLILAFFRGTTSQLLLIGYFCLWAIIWLVSWMKRPLADHPVQPHSRAPPLQPPSHKAACYSPRSSSTRRISVSMPVMGPHSVTMALQTRSGLLQS